MPLDALYESIGKDPQVDPLYKDIGKSVEEPKPSYWEAAKTGLKESIYGGLRRFEAPFKPLARTLGIPPGLEASEYFKPSEEELKRTGELGIPGEIVRGLAGAPATIASYLPYISALGPVAGFIAPEAMELAAEPKPIPEMGRRLAEATALGLGFKYLPPGLRYRVPGLAGMFGGQAFTETLAQTGDVKEALRQTIAPSVIGGAMGLVGGRRREARPIPEPAVREPLQIPRLPETGYQMGMPGYPRPEELPHPIVPYQRGGPMVDTGEYFGYETARPGATFRPPRGLPRPGEEHYPPFEMPPARPAWEPVRYPPVPFEPRPTPRIPPAPAPITIPGDRLAYADEIRELTAIIQRGEPGGKIGHPAIPGETVSWGTSQAIEAITGMKKVSRVDALTAIKKGMRGDDFKNAPKQKEIWESLKNMANGIRKDRIEEERIAIRQADPDWLRDETVDRLTPIEDNEIIGLKEELREQGLSEDEINRHVTAIGSRIEAEAPPPTIEGIKKTLSDEYTPKAVTPIFSPTGRHQFALPGIKVGLEFPKEGIPIKPTLEGTPLGEAARKAEIERVQPNFFGPEAKTLAAEVRDPSKFSIGDKVKSGEFKGVVADVDPDGTLRIGSPDGKMMEVTPDKVEADLPGRLPAVMADGELLIGSKIHGDIPPERYSEAKDVKIGWVDSEGNFFESKSVEAPPEPPPIDFRDPKAFRKFVESRNMEWPPKGKEYDTLKKEFDDLKPADFRIAEERPIEPLSRETIQGFADERLKTLTGAPEIEILDQADIPSRLSNQLAENLRKGIKGIYDPLSKKIYLIRDMMGSEADVLDTINHEAIGHYGAEAYLRKDADTFFNRVFLKYGRTGLQDIADQRGFDLNTPEGRLKAAREKFAQLAESGENPGLIKQFYVWIRTQLAKIFPDLKVSDAEIQTMIKNVREFLGSDELRAREAKTEALRTQIQALGTLTLEEPFKPAEFSLAKETARAGYKEEVEPKIKGLWATWEGLKKAFAPTTGVDVKDLDALMKMKGEKEFAEMKIENLTEKGTDYLAKNLTRDQQINFVDKIQSGDIYDLPPDLKTIERLHRTIEDSLWGEANSILAQMEEPARIAYLDNHVRNFWKVVPKGLEDEVQRRGFSGLWRRPLEGTKAPLHHQYWTLKEGMNAGGIPFTTNLLEMTRLNYADTMKLVTSHKMWNALLETDSRKFVKFGEIIPEGFKALDDPIAVKYFPPTKAGRWVVEENAARLLQNYLSRDLIRETPALRGIMGVKNITTALELGFSAFHAGFITIEAAASQMGLGLRKIWNQKMIMEGLKDIITTPKAGYDLFKTGMNWERLMKDPETFLKTTKGQEFMKMFPSAADDITWLFWGGGSMRMNEAYRINSINTFRENINSKNYIGAALRSIPALSQFMMKPLFETYIPAIKRAQFLREFDFRKIDQAADLLSGKITKAELARDVWRSVENRFGEMNFDNLWWNRTFKSGLQMLVRSVTWKLGNIREYGRAVTGQSGELIAALKEGRTPKLTQEMAWMWGVASITAGLAYITQKAFTGKDPENWKDLVYPQIDNQGGRLSLPTYMRDLFHVTHAPLRYVGSSMAGWFGRFTDIINNKDFYGVQVHDPNENIIMQRVDDLIHLVPLPFSIQTMKRMREEGQDPLRQIVGFLGATKAPYWIERTPAEQKASELKAAHLPIGGRSQKDFERGQLVKNYAKRYQEATLKGEATEDIMNQIREDIAGGKLYMQDLLRFRQRISKEPLITSVEHLPFKDILEVWSVSSTEEKKRLAPIVMRKYIGLRNPEDRILFFPKIKEIREEIMGQ